MIKFLFYVFVVLTISSTGLQANELPDEFEVFNPLDSKIAETRFKQCFPETDANKLQGLRVISYWGYKFSPYPKEAGCPPSNPICNPNIVWYKIDRIVKIEPPGLRYSDLRARIDANRDTSCTSPREFGSISRSVTARNAEFRFRGRQRSRVCPFWGGSWTVAEGTADIVAGLNLNNDFSVKNYSRVENESGEIFGFLRGDFARFAIGAFASNLGFIMPFALGAIDDVVDFQLNNTLGLGVDVTSGFDSGPLADLSSGPLLALDFDTDQSRSGFRDSGSGIDIEVIQTEFIPSGSELTNAKRFIQTETDFLRQIGQIQPERYVVEPNDTIWSITEKLYGDTRLHLLVERYAEKTGEILSPGETLNVPSWHELCERLKPNPRFVRSGETLWGKAQRGEIPADFDLVETLSGRKNLIYPFEELQISDEPLN